MKMEIQTLKPWQSKVLNAVAWLVGIRGEEAHVMTVTKGWEEELRKEAESETKES